MILCAGVMAARGLLENPAMFAGHEVNEKVVQDWVSSHRHAIICCKVLLFMSSPLYTISPIGAK